MPMLKGKYKDLRKHIQPGDVIAFGGKSHTSELIKWFTRSGVSHVGVILQRKITGYDSNEYFNEVIESTSLNGKRGVQVNRLSDRLEQDPDVQIWWLPLSQIARQKLDAGRFFGFLLEQKGKDYDFMQAAGSAIDFLDKLGGPGANREDFDKFFCSELVAAGLEIGRVLPEINSSEVTPIDLCRFKIFTANYYQLQGDRREISRYNSVDPTGWTN